jgi:hypothetical protein
MKRYETSQALRRALEDRLLAQVRRDGGDIQRLRRQTAFDRLLCRLFHETNPPWLLKGGYAMELRIRAARTTRDIDLAIRQLPGGAKQWNDVAVRNLLQLASGIELDDGFEFIIGEPMMDLDAAPYGGSRYGKPCAGDMGTAGKVVLLIDGAAGLENMGQDCFKDSAHIVTSITPLEHAGRVLEAPLGKNHPANQARQRRWARRLLKDKVRSLIKKTRPECKGQPQAQAVQEQLGYFKRNIQRMQYGSFRAASYFIVSGVVEAGCKQSGNVLVSAGRRKCPSLALQSPQPPLGLLLQRQAQSTRQIQ